MNTRGPAQARFDADLEALVRRVGDAACHALGHALGSSLGAPFIGPFIGPIGRSGTGRPSAGQSWSVRRSPTASVAHARVGSKGADRRRIRVDLDGPAANLLLVIDDGSGVLVPAIASSAATLVFDEGELTDVSFEPVEGSARRQAFSRQEHHLRACAGWSPTRRAAASSILTQPCGGAGAAGQALAERAKGRWAWSIHRLPSMPPMLFRSAHDERDPGARALPVGRIVRIVLRRRSAGRRASQARRQPAPDPAREPRPDPHPHPCTPRFRCSPGAGRCFPPTGWSCPHRWKASSTNCCRRCGPTSIRQAGAVCVT